MQQQQPRHNQQHPDQQATNTTSSSPSVFNFGTAHFQHDHSGERNAITTNENTASTLNPPNDLSSWMMSLGMAPMMFLQQQPSQHEEGTTTTTSGFTSPFSISSAFESLQNGLVDLASKPKQQQMVQQMQTDHDVSPQTQEQNDSGSDHNGSNEGHELPGGDFHSIACVNCRRLHRKCDKKLPSCSECIDKVKECYYRTPKKKGRTKGSKNKPKDSQTTRQNDSSETSPEQQISSSAHSETISTSPSGKTKLSFIRKSTHPYMEINQSLLDGVVKRRTLDMFFDKMNGAGCSILSKEKVEKLALEYLAHPEDESPYDNVNYKTQSMRNGVRCLLYSMQALYEQQMGFRETSQLAYREARKSLGFSFDELDNFYIKVSYSLLASYLAGEGDDAIAKFYLNALKYAIENTSNNYMSHEGVQNANEEEEMSALIALMEKNSLGCRYTDVHDLKIWDGFDVLYRLKTRKQTPYELDKLLQKGVTPDDVPMLLKLISLLNNVIEGYAHSHSYSSSQIQFTFLMKDIICFGAEIVVYLSIGIDEGETIENLANKIILLTEREPFAYLPVAMTHFVSLGAYIHGKMFPKIESIITAKMNQGRAFHAIMNDDYERQYFEIVHKGLRAMNSMATRFKRVTKYYGNIINQLKKIQQWKVRMENESYQAILEKRPPPTFSSFSSPKSSSSETNSYIQQLQPSSSSPQQQLFPRSALLSSFSENTWRFIPQSSTSTATQQQKQHTNHHPSQQQMQQAQFMKQFHPPLLLSKTASTPSSSTIGVPQRSPSVMSSSLATTSSNFYNPHAVSSSQPVMLRPQNLPQTPVKTSNQQEETSTLDEWLSILGDPSEDDILGSLFGEIHQTLQNNF